MTARQRTDDDEAAARAAVNERIVQAVIAVKWLYDDMMARYLDYPLSNRDIADLTELDAALTAREEHAR